MSSEQLAPFVHSAQAKFIEAPNPEWTLGQRVDATPEGREWLEGEKAGWKVVDASREDPNKLYALMITGIVPRPIAFVSSISPNGVENLAPFSWFNMLTGNPPLVSISLLNLPGGLKDTADNIKATKGFTVNIISEPFIHNANACAVDTPPETSEWPLSGLTPEPSLHVEAPRVKESAFSMECELYQIHDLAHPDTGAVTTTLILGLVKYIHIRADMLNARGYVDPVKLRAVGKMGDITYARQGDMFRVPRPTWARDSSRIEELHASLKEQKENPEKSKSALLP
ncbi:uncharacterized protein FIBRA_08943 [Fibroporia radiculosa]|uniref:Flavin reductase like domain-containing protein n=1 Tax=Fibroporia radiculosa TaxID=599839 RepID=J4GIJ9_9APHY|nr:uncharacterized protein FIBRA_08943 [Fibroporia radiculosa]CCM06658.1 predicted protein [Fibroporia radiculosa]